MQVVIYDIDGTFLYPSLDAAAEKIKELYGQKPSDHPAGGEGRDDRTAPGRGGPFAETADRGSG